MNNKEKKIINVYLLSSQVEKLNEFCERRKVSRAVVVRAALDEYLKLHDK